MRETKVELGDEYDLTIEEMPALDLLYPHLAHEKATDAFEPYPEPEVPQKVEDMEIYLHSSGSTGFPKAIGHTHASIAGWSRLAMMRDGHRSKKRFRLATHMLPAFHTIGICVHLMTPMHSGSEVALYPPLVKTPTDVPPPPTPDSRLEGAQACGCTGLISVPAYIHQWAENPSAVEYLKTLQVLMYGGGPVSDGIGDNLSAAGVKLRSVYGATEFGAPTHIFPTHEEDWKEWCWSEFDREACLVWEDQGDGTKELIIPAGNGHWHQPAAQNMEDRPGYATNDLFIRHPTNSYLRKVIGRKDDVIVHSTGEKTVPAPIEGAIVTSPLVRTAIMFGRGKDEAGVLVEPALTNQVDVDDDLQVAALRDAIWPTVEEANRGAPAYSRIFKELILVTRPDKPLPRTEKGTVMRKLALRAYNDEIKKIYELVESHASKGNKGVEPPSSWKAPDVVDWLTEHVRDVTGRDMSRDVDLFEQGFDSLNATVLRLRILGALKANTFAAPASPQVTQNIVYQHPSIEKLAAFVSQLVCGGNATAQSPETVAEGAIIALAAKYSKGLPGYVDVSTLPKYVPAASASLQLPAIVLLTGTTGNLGAEILAMLLKDDRVTRIYTLERAGKTPVKERQRARFVDKGFDTSLLDLMKLVALEGDLSADMLGQSDEMITEMLNTVNLIIHVAWRLDFNLGELIEDPGVSVHGGGYGQGKYVAERVLAASGIAFSSVRVGQISGGPPRGAWSTTDWFPILVKTSVELGALPGSEQDVPWLSMDAVAGTLLDAAFSKTPLSPSHNAVHPRPVAWSQMIKNIQQSLKSVVQRDVPIISFADWVSKLEAASTRPDVDVQEVPGVKLLEFFRGMDSAYGHGEFATDKMQTVSETLRHVKPLVQEDADAWVKYWRESALL
ncbi:hypothetical protein EV122DRAFT_295427 [Schizophyllum commune]